MPVPVPEAVRARGEFKDPFTVILLFLLFLVGLTGGFHSGEIKFQRFFVPRATPHTKPGVGAGNGAFWGFVLERNKQATGGSSRGGLGWIFSQFFFIFFLCLF